MQSVLADIGFRTSNGFPVFLKSQLLTGVQETCADLASFCLVSGPPKLPLAHCVWVTSSSHPSITQAVPVPGLLPLLSPLPADTHVAHNLISVETLLNLDSRAPSLVPHSTLVCLASSPHPPSSSPPRASLKCWSSPSLPLGDAVPEGTPSVLLTAVFWAPSSVPGAIKLVHGMPHSPPSGPPAPDLSPASLSQGPFVHIASICAAVLSRFMSMFCGVYEVRLRK